MNDRDIHNLAFALGKTYKELMETPISEVRLAAFALGRREMGGKTLFVRPDLYEKPQTLRVPAKIKLLRSVAEIRKGISK